MTETTPRPTPLVDECWIGGIGDHTGIWEIAKLRDVARQLERDRAELIESLTALRDKMNALNDDLKGVFTFYAAHGMKWTADKTWKAEADAADDLLARLKG